MNLVLLDNYAKASVVPKTRRSSRSVLPQFTQWPGRIIKGTWNELAEKVTEFSKLLQFLPGAVAKNPIVGLLQFGLIALLVWENWHMLFHSEGFAKAATILSIALVVVLKAVISGDKDED